MLFRSKLILALGLLLSLASFTSSTFAGINVSIDWDSTLAGIQSSVTANPGDSVSARIVFELDGATSLAGYVISTRFSTDSLVFVSRTDVDSSGSGGLPVSGNAALDNLNTGNATPPIGNYGELQNIAGITSGTGPSTGSFVSSILNFTIAPGAVSGPAILVGSFTANDGFLDNNSNDVLADVTFNGGSINVSAVPEPTALTLASIGLVSIGFHRLKRRFAGRKTI